MKSPFNLFSSTIKLSYKVLYNQVSSNLWQLKIYSVEYSQTLCRIQRGVLSAPECTTCLYKFACLGDFFTKVQTFILIFTMQVLSLTVLLAITSATFHQPDFNDIYDQLERIRFCSNGNCRVWNFFHLKHTMHNSAYVKIQYMRYQQSMRKRALLDGIPAYYIGQHHKKCSLPCQRESLYLR